MGHRKSAGRSITRDIIVRFHSANQRICNISMCLIRAGAAIETPSSEGIVNRRLVCS